MKKLALFGGVPVGKINYPTWPVFGEEEKNELLSVLNSGYWAYRGPKEELLEKEFALFCGTKYAVAASNGTHTLRLALEALDIGPGDEVIVPGSTWQATAASVLDVNAVPILVDMHPDNYCIDPACIEKAITARTKCIIPVHLYSRMCDMDAVMGIAGRYGLRVIEDCAHQHGSAWKGRCVGGIGDIGSFSLQSSKIFTTGEGGLLTTNNETLYKRLQSLKNCGRADTDGIAMQSGNYRMTEFQAAVGLCQLRRLREQNETRDINAHYLDEKLADIQGIKVLGRDARVTRQAYYHYSLKFLPDKWEGISREMFVKALYAELEGCVEIMIPYTPLNHSPLYRPLSKKTHKLDDKYIRDIDPSRFELPVCDEAYKQQYIGLPQQFLLAEQNELDRFVEAVKKVRGSLGEMKENA